MCPDRHVDSLQPKAKKGSYLPSSLGALTAGPLTLTVLLPTTQCMQFADTPHHASALETQQCNKQCSKLKCGKSLSRSVLHLPYPLAGQEPVRRRQQQQQNFHLRTYPHLSLKEIGIKILFHLQTISSHSLQGRI